MYHFKNMTILNLKKYNNIKFIKFFLCYYNFYKKKYCKFELTYYLQRNYDDNINHYKV